MRDEVYQPMIDLMKSRGMEQLEAESEARDHLGEYLMLHRVANDRASVANPAGFTPTPAKEQLLEIEKKLGKEAFARMEQLARKFHDLVFEVAERAVKEGVYSKKSLDEIIEPNRDSYAAFRVTAHVDHPDVIGTGIIRQVGTFSDIGNPLEATLLKIVRLNRLIELNRAKNRVRLFLEKRFPDDVSSVEMKVESIRVDGTPKKVPKDKPKEGHDHVAELIDGVPTYFEVPNEIAKSFKHHDIGGLTRIAAINNLTYSIFHPLFVTYSPGFALANPFRDLRRTWKNLGATDNVTLRELLVEWYKAIPVAKRRADGIDDKVVSDMIENHALDIPYTDIAVTQLDDAKSDTQRIFAKAGLKTEAEVKEKPTWIDRVKDAVPPLGKIMDTIEMVGQVTESATKIAGWRVLERRGHGVQERAWRVRKYVGTPDYKQRGLATSITNSVMMYSRVRVNGLQADIDLATNPTTRAGWWWRQLADVIVPTSMAKFAAYGGFGVVLQAMLGVDDDDDGVLAGVARWPDTYKRVSKYFLTDYDVLPLGVTSDGDAAFVSIPRDDLGKFIARVLWHATDVIQLAAGQELRDVKSARDVTTDLIRDVFKQAIPSFSPTIEIPHKWSEFAAGGNPEDPHFNQPIIPRWEQRARSVDSGPAFGKMVAWTLDKFGTPGAVLHQLASPLLGEPFETGTTGGVEAILKTGLKLAGLSRFFRFSKSGLTNAEWAKVFNMDAENAAFRISLPQNAQKATSRRFFLMRKEATEQALDAGEVQELVNLQLFYSAVYLPLRKLLKKADEDGNKDASKSLRADMKAAASKPESLLESPPASVAPFVSKYLQGIVMSGSKPEPKRRDYKGDLEAFKSASEKYTATQGQREGRLRQLVPTYEKAYELLKQDYEDRGGTRHQRRSGKPRKESFRRRNKKLKKIYRG